MNIPSVLATAAGTFTSGVGRLIAQAGDLLSQLPPEVVDRLPPDVVQQIRDGTLDRLPEEVVARLPADLQDKIPPGVVDFATANPGFTVFLVVLGLISAALFVWGIMRNAIKVAVFSGVVAAGAWYWFFQQ